MPQPSVMRLLLIDPDERFQSRVRSWKHAGFETTFHTPRHSGVPDDLLCGHDVIVVGIDTALGLNLLADLCNRPDLPPIIAAAGAGFDGKPLEHLLILAELRGADATMLKAMDAGELASAAFEVMQRRGLDAPTRRHA